MAKKLRGKKCSNGLLENPDKVFNANHAAVKAAAFLLKAYHVLPACILFSYHIFIFHTFVPVKKMSAIFFFTVYLFSTTEAHQLLKLPLIFEHFSEHQQENRQITFTEFLKIHYLNPPVKDKDYDKDMQLPFKSFGDCISSISPAFVPVTIQHTAAESIDISPEKIFFLKDQMFISSYLANIWQPPKHC